MKNILIIDNSETRSKKLLSEFKKKGFNVSHKKSVGSFELVQEYDVVCLHFGPSQMTGSYDAFVNHVRAISIPPYYILYSGERSQIPDSKVIGISNIYVYPKSMNVDHFAQEVIPQIVNYNPAVSQWSDLF